MDTPYEASGGKGEGSHDPRPCHGPLMALGWSLSTKASPILAYKCASFLSHPVPQGFCLKSKQDSDCERGSESGSCSRGGSRLLSVLSLGSEQFTFLTQLWSLGISSQYLALLTLEGGVFPLQFNYVFAGSC